MKQKEIAKELGYSSSTLQHYRQDTKMQSPYKSNNPKKCQMTTNDLDLKRACDCFVKPFTKN